MPTLKLGVAMAGAISAGAYTAGVVDFLVEALDEFYKQKKAGGDRTDHDLLIAALSGASAGAIAGGIAAVSIPGHDVNASPRLPELFNTWVAMPDLTVSSGTIAPMLSLTDLSGGAVRSLLNATGLSDIGLTVAAGPVARPGECPYLPQSLHLYMTHSNLRGVPYTVDFTGNGHVGYTMMCHADRSHYVIQTESGITYNSPWADGDPHLALNCANRPANAAGMAGNAAWSDYVTAVLGSGAFPIGLMARQIMPLTTSSYNGRRWPQLLNSTSPKPDWPGDWMRTAPGSPTPDYRYCTVDGGVFDNNPFEYAFRTVKEPGPAGNDPDGSDYTTVMISPFPEQPVFQKDEADALDTLLVPVIKRLVTAVMEQNRFRIDELAQALDHTDLANYEKWWLISPRRYSGNGLEEEAIACGLLGGFGGFVDRSFRQHDYDLGRKNCQDFLNNWFGYPADTTNGQPAPRTGYANVMLPQFNDGFERPTPPYSMMAFLPLLGTAAKPVSAPVWPRIPQSKLDGVMDMAMTRVAKLLPLVVNEQIKSKFFAWTAKLLITVFGMSRIRDMIYNTILADLVRRDQINLVVNSKPFPLAGTNLIRRVLGACIDPSYDFRTAGGIARDIGVDSTQISSVLSSLAKQGIVVPYTGPRDIPARDAYTYADRGRGWVRRTIIDKIPGINMIPEFFSTPVID